MSDYTDLFYYNPIPNWIYDLETFEILDVNQAAMDLYGYSREEFLAITLKELSHNNKVPSVFRTYGTEDQKIGNMYFGSITHRTKGGECIRVDLNGHKVAFQERRSMMVVCQDITQRERQLFDLQASEKILKRVSEIAKIGYWKYDLATATLNASDQVYAIWGKKKEDSQFGFEAHFCCIPPNHWDSLDLDKKSSVSRHEAMDYVHRTQLPDGSLRWIQEQGSIIKNAEGKPISIEGTVQDITLQKKEEQRLKLLESVVTHTNDAVMITEAEPLDAPGPKILYVNQAFTQMTGYTPEEVIGKSPRILQGPKSNKEELKQMGKALRKWNSCEITTINYKKNGTPFWVNFSVSPVADEKGWFTHFISIERDVTEKINEQVQKDFWAEISLAFKKGKNLKDSFNKVCKSITAYGDFSFCEIWLPTIHKNSLRLTANYGKDAVGKAFYQNTHELKEIKYGEGLTGSIWENKKSTFWGNIDRNPFFIRKQAAKRLGIQSVLCIPLKHKETITGILVIGSVENEKELKSSALGLSKLENYIGSEIYRKRKEEDLRNMFETLPDILCITDLEGKFLEMNKVGCDLLGYSEAEIVGASFHKFIHAEDKQISDKIVQDIREGKKVFQLENRYITKTGKVIWLSWRFKIVSEEGISFATGKDITESKKLQEVVSNASSLAKTGGWEIDLIKDRLIWSQGVHKIHETDPDTYRPKLDEAIEFYREDYKNRVKGFVNQTITTGEPLNFEAAIITKKGNQKWVSAIGQVEMVNNKPSRVYGSFQDITHLKETEHRLQDISNDLPGVSFQYYLYPDGTDKMGAVSQKSIEIWGLTPEQCEQDNQKVWDQIQKGGDYEKLAQKIQTSVETLTQWHYQWKNISPDGKISWHEGYGTPYKLPDGTILFNSMIFDITEKMKLANLHEETSELAKIGSWELDFLKDSKKDAMYWSPIFRKIIGVDANYDATFKGSLKFYTPESRSALEHSLEQLIDYGTEYDLEMQLTTGSGQKKWVRLIGNSERVNGICTKIYGSIQDIHSMKTTQLQLEEILGSISNGFYALDKNWNFTYFNKEAENLLGKKRKQVLGKNLWEQFAPAIETPLETVYRRVAAKGIAESFEYFYPGDKCWYEISVYPSNGGISAYFYNIDEKKNAAEALQKAYEEKNLILESIGDAFFAVDKHWIITYWNNQAEQLMGRKRNAMLGKSLWDEYPEAVELKFFSKYHQVLASGKTVSFEEFYPAMEKWLEVTAYPNKDGLSVYFKDVTLRKQTDLQIQQANERFEKVTQATTDAIWDWDIKNKVLHRSSGFEKLLGMTMKKNLNEKEIWRHGFHPDDYLTIKSSITKCLQDHSREFWKKEYRIIDEKGTIKTVIDKGVIIRNDQGEAIRMVGAVADISERIKHEKELQELNEALKNNIKHLEITNDQLEQFAFIASHDLQEPLRMITSFLNQLQRKYSGQLDEKADQYINFATDGAKRMKQIILDLLEYSKAGKELEKPETIDLNKIIEDYQVLRGRLICEKSVKILTGNFPKVTCFKAPLTQTLHCLLDNAIKYSKDGKPPVIRISVTDKKAYWQVKIKDNGIGIDPRFFDKVFIIFQRLHDKNTYSGTGMGLSISKKNIESWGGKIWLESELGNGSDFYFTIKKNVL